MFVFESIDGLCNKSIAVSLQNIINKLGIAISDHDRSICKCIKRQYAERPVM